MLAQRREDAHSLGARVISDLDGILHAANEELLVLGAGHLERCRLRGIGRRGRSPRGCPWLRKLLCPKEYDLAVNESIIDTQLNNQQALLLDVYVRALAGLPESGKEVVIIGSGNIWLDDGPSSSD